MLESVMHLVTSITESWTSAILLFLLTLIAVRGLMYLFRAADSYPPGPLGLPIVGHLPFLGNDPLPKLADYRKQYGDIFSIQMGSYPVVVLNGHNVIRKALTTHLDDFAGRPKLYTNVSLEDVRGTPGLAFADFGNSWKTLHRITNQALRLYASHRRSPVEDIILEEAMRLVEYFKSHEGQPFNPEQETCLATGSVIYQLLFGRHSNIREDKKYLEMVRTLKYFIDFCNAGNPIDVMPWTRFFYKNTLKNFLDNARVGYKACVDQMKSHLETVNSNDIRDITDSLILASWDLSEEDKTLDLSLDRIPSVLHDMLMPGSETVSTSLLWSFAYLVKFPEVQARVQAEIDNHIGNGRNPTYDDKKSMPYVEATMLEVHRISTIGPLGLPHSTTRDVELMGYRIPKNTFVMVNYGSTSTDTADWGDPEVFRPERFLTSTGVDSSKADVALTFGAGRRRCIGEFLGKQEYFIFFVYILQHCSIVKAQGELNTSKGSFGLTLKPFPYDVVFQAR